MPRNHHHIKAQVYVGEPHRYIMDIPRRKITVISWVDHEENHRYITGMSNVHGKNRPVKPGVVTSLLL